MSRKAVPLFSKQVQAAGKLHAQLTVWNATDAALDQLARSFPAFDLPSSLLKVVAVNQLYGTNVLAVVRMAEHVVATMATRPKDADLVDKLAELPKASADADEWKFLSFASKFAHFFVDRESFPILDSYAKRMVALHLGRPQASSYREYVADFGVMRASLDEPCTGRELDRYLWLGGLYRAWSKDREAQINDEVRRLFVRGRTDGGVAALLRDVNAEEAEMGTTKPGYKNGNGQVNLGLTNPPRPGTDHLQYVYVMRCLRCERNYGANGTDIFHRLCPYCDKGQPGEPLMAHEERMTWTAKGARPRG